jgi:hypothetical protein
MAIQGRLLNDNLCLFQAVEDFAVQQLIAPQSYIRRKC